MNTISRNRVIDILDAYTQYLLDHGYVDSDVYSEPPTALDDFIATSKFTELRQIDNQKQTENESKNY